ncbi:hypothetical protein PYH37_005379 [Sinorhizobium numidicum]|uniref:Transposase n=1 Tax=Sinorhizobium numidicum TaxID=680248 RepID=A0ABY8D1V3_9HYPH|nr:hypothetical protein [Sinorhizobium numidicum]WEX77019.1 hypothetical protein PYH37_005379 [Sinorhizobium numidicum]WEX83678.1 hypothetical protein PYH38_002472 [Sinorhizobium numidicum]
MHIGFAAAPSLIMAEWVRVAKLRWNRENAHGRTGNNLAQKMTRAQFCATTPRALALQRRHIPRNDICP